MTLLKNTTLGSFFFLGGFAGLIILVNLRSPLALVSAWSLSQTTVLSSPRILPRRNNYYSPIGRRFASKDQWTSSYLYRPQRSQRTTTSLGMGIRSLLGLGGKKGKKNEGEPPPRRSSSEKTVSTSRTKQIVDRQPSQRTTRSSAPDPSSPDPTLQSRPAAADANVAPPRPMPNALQQKQQKQQRMRMGEDPATGELNINSLSRDGESVQERINRVKSGKMTEEEKAAFLNTALSAGNTAESRKPLRTPQQQQAAEEQRVSASPFPTDSILRNFARGRGSGGNNATSGGRNGGSGDDYLEGKGLDAQQRKKREYLDMVTNPDRFHRYKTAPLLGVTPRPDGGGDATVNGARQQPEGNGWQGDPAGPESGGAVSTNNNNTPMPVDLGARLGAAAMANEHNRRQAEEERQKKTAEERREMERRAAEAMKARQEEMARREAALQAKKRQEEEAALRMREEKQRAEEQRLAQLYQAQEEYWAKKLASERQAMIDREKKEQLEAAAEQQQQESKAAAAEATPVAEQGEEEASPETEDSLAPDAASDPSAGPDEMELLDLGGEDTGKQQEKGSVIDRIAAASQSHPSPSSLNDVQTERERAEEQAKISRELDTTQDEQLQRLKALNSPLPPPPPGAPPAVAPPAVFQPQRSVGSKGPPRPSLGGLLDDIHRGSDTGTTTASQRSDGGWRRQTSKRPDSSEDITISEVTRLQKPEPEPEEEHEPKKGPSPWARFLSTRKTNNDGQSKTEESNREDEEEEEITIVENTTTSPPPQRVSPTPASAKTRSPAPAPAPAPPPPERKGPIRMQLPLDDDEDDDLGEDGINVRANKSMSIADAMQRTVGSAKGNQGERSKMWGVDMSRFLVDGEE